MPPNTDSQLLARITALELALTAIVSALDHRGVILGLEAMRRAEHDTRMLNVDDDVIAALRQFGDAIERARALVGLATDNIRQEAEVRQALDKLHRKDDQA